MKIRRDLIIVALTTFCLTTTLFMMKPTMSNPGIGEYDSWTDLNGDGTVDIYDAINLANVFGTSGDPTKNVNVTNFPEVEPKLATKSFTYRYNNPYYNVGDPYMVLTAIVTEGYRKIYLYLTGNNFNLTTGWTIGGTFNASNQDWYGQIEHYEDTEIGMQNRVWREFDIKGRSLVIILGDVMGSPYFDLRYYLTT